MHAFVSKARFRFYSTEKLHAWTPVFLKHALNCTPLFLTQVFDSIAQKNCKPLFLKHVLDSLGQKNCTPFLSKAQSHVFVFKARFRF